MPRANGYVSCCACHCMNTSLTKPHYSFFSIPEKDPIKRVLWLRRIGRTDWISKPIFSRTRRVCEEHFGPECIIYTNNRRILKKTAVPSVNLMSGATSQRNRYSAPSTSAIGVYSASKLTQTEDDIEMTENTPTSAIFKKTVVPSVNLISGATSQRNRYSAPSTSAIGVHSASKLTQTEDDIEMTENTPTSASIQTLAIDNFDTYFPEKSFQELCDKLLPQELAPLINANQYLKYKSTRKFHGYKNFYTTLYQTSPQAYHYLQSIFCLPTSTLIVRRYLQIGTEVNEKLMMTLKPRVSKMKAVEKNCSVLIDSMSLKANLCYNIKEDKIIGFQEINGVQSPKPTTRALVVMIRGMFSNWKLPISYALVSGRENGDEISAWIGNLLKSLFKIGLNVRSLTSTLEDDSIDYAMSVSAEKPYFFIGDRKVYFIFNAPDLIISVRDSMASYDFHFEDNVAKYEYIQKFYNEDQNRTLPIAEKLTNSHINPVNDEKREVRYAAQLLSRTVANGLGNYIAFKRIDAGGMGTVEFITKINDCFDMLNASNRRNEHNENKKAFCGDIKIQFFKELLYLFGTITVIHSDSGKDVTLTTKFIRGFLITIQSVLLLFDSLKKEGHSFLLTKNMQLEELKTFFKQITKKQKSSTILTTLQFTSAFRKLFFLYHKKFTLKGCSKGELSDFVAHVDKLKEETEQDADCPDTKPQTECNPNLSTNEEDIRILKGDYTAINSPETHTLIFVSAYLLRKCKKKHNCQSLSESEGVLLVPYEFVQSIKKMDEKFIEIFESQQIYHKIAASVYNGIEQINLSLPCPCLSKIFLTKLFVRIRIFYTIRANNRMFRKNRNTLNFSIPKL